MEIWEELSLATRGIKTGKIHPDQATATRIRASLRLKELRARNHRGYADEIAEIEGELNRLQLAVTGRPDAPIVRIFHRPERFVTRDTLDPYTGNMRPMKHRLPDVSVIRTGQVPFIELDGRQRVRDWYELFVDGAPIRPPCQGPKRWIMKNAQGAAMMDHTGSLPPWIFFTGLRRRRSVYRRARDKRRAARTTKSWRDMTKRKTRQAIRRAAGRVLVFRGKDVKMRLVRADGVVVFDDIGGSPTI